MELKKMTIGDLESMGARVKVFFHNNRTEKESYELISKFGEPVKNHSCGDTWFEVSRNLTDVVSFFKEET